eukprot:443770-Rhodomonas_salina.1
MSPSGQEEGDSPMGVTASFININEVCLLRARQRDRGSWLKWNTRGRALEREYAASTASSVHTEEELGSEPGSLSEKDMGAGR